MSWLTWELSHQDREFLEFTRRIISLRKEHPLFRRRYFFRGQPIRGGEVKDIVWLNPEGLEMSDADWNRASSRCLGVHLAGDMLLETDGRGQRLVDDNLLLLINADHEDISFTLPECKRHDWWHVLLDTFDTADTPAGPHYRAGQGYLVHGRALVLLKQGGAQ